MIVKAEDSYSNNGNENLLNPNSAPTFFSLRDERENISQNDYYDFIRTSIIEQPEYAYSISTVAEKNMLLKFQQRTRYQT